MYLNYLMKSCTSSHVVMCECPLFMRTSQVFWEHGNMTIYFWGTLASKHMFQGTLENKTENYIGSYFQGTLPPPPLEGLIYHCLIYKEIIEILVYPMQILSSCFVYYLKHEHFRVNVWVAMQRLLLARKYSKLLLDFINPDLTSVI